MYGGVNTIWCNALDQNFGERSLSDGYLCYTLAMSLIAGQDIVCSPTFVKKLAVLVEI